MAAEFGRGGSNALRLDAIGTVVDRRQWQAFYRIRIVVARQRNCVHRLAGAIDAAVEIGVDVEWAGSGPALHTTVGQVETGAGQIEENEIGLAAGCPRGEQGWRQAGRAPHKAGIEYGLAGFIGRSAAQHLVVAREQGQFDSRLRLCAVEAVGNHRQPVIARPSDQADVGNEEPLRGARVPFVAVLAIHCGGQHIDAGLAPGQRFVHGEAGHDFPVTLGRKINRTFPDQRTQIGFELRKRIGVELRQKIGLGDEPVQRPVADAIEFQIGAIGINAGQRNAAAGGTGQHEIVAIHAHGGRAVADITVEDGRFAQCFANRGGQSLAQGEAVFGTMVQPLGAKSAAGGRDGGGVRAAHRNELLVVHAGFHQFLGEVHADAWTGAVGFNLVTGHAEALFLTQLLVGFGDLG